MPQTKASKPRSTVAAPKRKLRTAANLPPVRVATRSSRTTAKQRPAKAARTLPVPEAARHASAVAEPELDPGRLRELEHAARALGAASFDAHDAQIARSAASGQDAWVVDVDAQHARARTFAMATQLQKPLLFVSPSHELLAQAYQTLLAARVPVVWLDAPNEAARPVRRGAPQLVLATPAALRSSAAVRLAGAGVACVVVDEAHLACELAHEFRPSYADLGEVFKAFAGAPVHALSRPVPTLVRQQASRLLGLRSPSWHAGMLLGPHVAVDARVVRAGARQAQLKELLSTLTPPGIVLCATPHEVDGLFATLKTAGVPVRRAHPGMPREVRSAELLAFAAEDCSVLLGTSPYAPTSGLLGLREASGSAASRTPLPKARFLVYYHAPASLEQYVRDLGSLHGSAGAAVSILFYESAHRSLNDAILAQQRLTAAQCEDLGRALALLASQKRSLSLEALALHSGQSRRTTERLLCLFRDARLLSSETSAPPLLLGEELHAACQQLGHRLQALRSGDAGRLAAVESFAEGRDCRARALCHYFGQSASPCGRCSRCSPSTFLAGQWAEGVSSSQRRGAPSAFSVER